MFHTGNAVTLRIWTAHDFDFLNTGTGIAASLGSRVPYVYIRSGDSGRSRRNLLDRAGRYRTMDFDRRVRRRSRGFQPPVVAPALIGVSVFDHVLARARIQYLLAICIDISCTGKYSTVVWWI